MSQSILSKEVQDLVDQIQYSKSQAEIVKVISSTPYFQEIKEYVMDRFDIDYTDGRFIDEHNPLLLGTVKSAVINALQTV